MQKTPSPSSLLPEIMIRMLQSFGSAVCLLDKDRTVIYANPAFDLLFGLTGTEALGKRFGQGISCHETSLEADRIACSACRFQQGVAEAFKTRSTQPRKTMVMQIESEGETRLRLVVFEVCYFTGQEQEMVAVIFDDITYAGDAAANIPYSGG